MHYGADDPYAALFSEIEPIFKRYRGRPHWGKLNSLQASELKALYPEYTTFDNIRRQLDPHNRFLNPYLQSIFDA